MMAAWMKADDMNEARGWSGPFYSPQGSSRGAKTRIVQFSSSPGKRGEVDPTVPRQSLDLHHRQGQHRNRQRLMRQPERKRNLVQQGQDAEPRLQYDRG